MNKRALQRAFTDPERMAQIHKAGVERHGGRWLNANIAAVNAANATGLDAEAYKVPISQIVLRVLDTTLTKTQREALAKKLAAIGGKADGDSKTRP